MLKLYSDADIQNIADAIRSKNGSSDTYKVSEMAQAISDIQTGYSLNDIATGAEPSGVLDISGLGAMKNSAFVECHNVTKVIGTSAITQNRGQFFRDSLGITEVHVAFPQGVAGSSIFNGCTSLKKAVFINKLTVTGGTYIFYGCTSLEVADLTIKVIYNRCFENDARLTTLILRNPDITAIPNIGANDPFTGTPFAQGGIGGEIYIPKPLYDHLGDGTESDYKSATNWSTIDGYGTITWKQIEGSQYENYYADGTPIE